MVAGMGQPFGCLRLRVTASIAELAFRLMEPSCCGKGKSLCQILKATASVCSGMPLHGQQACDR